MRLFPVLALATCTPILPGADFESWHTFELVPVVKERFDLTLHTQFRTRSRFGDFGQIRFGPIARFALHPHAILVGGYYYTDAEDSRKDWGDNHRAFFGIENPFREGRYVLHSRVNFEHFFGAPSPPYHRLRHRLRVSRAGRIEPYAQFEYFIVGKGLQALRYVAGVQRAMPRGARLDIGYLYDDFHIGKDRQALITSLRFDISRRR